MRMLIGDLILALYFRAGDSVTNSDTNSLTLDARRPSQGNVRLSSPGPSKQEDTSRTEYIDEERYGGDELGGWKLGRIASTSSAPAKT